MSEQRIKGQEISIRIVTDGAVEDQIDAISSFNEAVLLELKEQGYLGEIVNRFDDILNGFGGDMEFNVHRAAWNRLQTAIIERATRAVPGRVFNVVRTDLFPNGDSTIYTYVDVNWGEIPTSVASRSDYVKPKLQFKCSQRPFKNNAIA